MVSISRFDELQFEQVLFVSLEIAECQPGAASTAKALRDPHKVSFKRCNWSDDRLQHQVAFLSLP